MESTFRRNAYDRALKIGSVISLDLEEPKKEKFKN
jgi:hypothetical protein